MENHTVNKLTNRINELNSAILNIKGNKVHILGFMSKEMMEKYFEGSKNWYVMGLYDKEEMSFFDTKDNAFFIVQKEGIEIAKSQGKYKGRVKKYNKNHEGMNYAIKLYHEGNMTVKQICQITNISKSSLYRRLSEEKIE